MSHEVEAILRIKPFFIWAGSKQRAIKYIRQYLPDKGRRYIEPFLGAGVVALNVSNYQSYIVNDSNRDVMSVWSSLAVMGMEFVKECKKLFVPKNATEDAFLRLRNEFNETAEGLRKVYLFVYLNRHSRAGLCRYNKKGKFNASFNTSRSFVPYFPEAEFRNCLERAREFQIHNRDFREIFDMVRKNDIVYCDPPYLKKFNGHTPGRFSLADHQDLAACAEKSRRKGAKVIISNSESEEARRLYTKYGADIFTIQVARTINCDKNGRGPVTEIVAVF